MSNAVTLATAPLPADSSRDVPTRYTPEDLLEVIAAGAASTIAHAPGSITSLRSTRRFRPCLERFGIGWSRTDRFRHLARWLFRWSTNRDGRLCDIRCACGCPHAPNAPAVAFLAVDNGIGV